MKKVNTKFKDSLIAEVEEKIQKPTRLIKKICRAVKLAQKEPTTRLPLEWKKLEEHLQEIMKQWQHQVAKCESEIKGAVGFSNFTSGILNEKHEKEIDEILDILRVRETHLDTLRGDWERLKKGREYFLSLNIGNVGLYIEKEEDISKHRGLTK